MAKLQEKRAILTIIGILAFLSLWMFFVSTNINPALGTIYNGLALLSIGIIIANNLYGKSAIKFINRQVTDRKSVV